MSEGRWTSCLGATTLRKYSAYGPAITVSSLRGIRRLEFKYRELGARSRECICFEGRHLQGWKNSEWRMKGQEASSEKAPVGRSNTCGQNEKNRRRNRTEERSCRLYAHPHAWLASCAPDTWVSGRPPV